MHTPCVTHLQQVAHAECITPLLSQTRSSTTATIRYSTHCSSVLPLSSGQCTYLQQVSHAPPPQCSISIHSTHMDDAHPCVTHLQQVSHAECSTPLLLRTCSSTTASIRYSTHRSPVRPLSLEKCPHLQQVAHATSPAVLHHNPQHSHGCSPHVGAVACATSSVCCDHVTTAPKMSPDQPQSTTRQTPHRNA
jgi:hypothetical protein